MNEDNKLFQIWPLLVVGVIAAILLIAGTYHRSQKINPFDNPNLPYLKEAQGYLIPEQLVFIDWYDKTAPDFNVKDIDGLEHTLSHYKGREVLLIMWATWCAPCRTEIPDLIKLRDENAQTELAMLGISFEKIETIENFIEDRDINYPIISLQNQKLPKPYSQISYFPSAFFIDKNGKIKFATIGQLDIEQIKKLLDI